MLIYLAVCGLGLGPTMPLYTLAVQNATEPSLMGQAIPASQFFRQIEGALAASALGAVLTFTLAHSRPAAAQAPSASRPAVVAEGPAVPAGAAAPVVRAAFAMAIRRMYIVDILLIVPSLLLTLLTLLWQVVMRVAVCKFRDGPADY